MDEVEEKCCIRCHLVCPINCFKMNRKNVYNKCCIHCLIKMRKYQHENKEAITMLQKMIINIIKKLFAFIQTKWKIDNPEQFSNIHRIYYLENKDRLVEYGREYVKTHREKILK